MYWVLQHNIWEEEGFDRLLTALQRLQLPHSVHKVIPFVGEITDTEVLDAQPTGTKFIVMGSYSMARYAVRRGWVPGAFTENLDFHTQREQWGSAMLNHDAEIHRFDSIPEQINPFFVRPVHDTKAFTGAVYDWPDYRSWVERVKIIEDLMSREELEKQQLSSETPVMVCQKKEIYNETRCWIVNLGGPTVVTASLYKIGSQKRYEEVRATRWDNDLIAFAEDCAAKWSPNLAYVMDVADTPNGYKIVEVNNLNSSGWYKCDMNKLVMSLEDLGSTL